MNRPKAIDVPESIREALPPRIATYALCLGLGVVGLASALVSLGYTLTPLWETAVLAVAAAIAERSSVRLARGIDTEASISNLPILFAGVLFGPLPAMVVGASSMLGAFRPPYVRWGIYTCTRTINSGLTSLIAISVADLFGNRAAGIAAATIAGGIAVEVIDVAFNCLTFRLRGKKVTELARVLLPVSLASVPLYMPMVALLAMAYELVSPWTLPLFLVPALAAQRLFGLYQVQRRLAEDLSLVNQRLERANISFATALVATLDARDRYTAGHSAAVAIYARDIAERLGLPEKDQQLAHLCGLVHDIGKIGLPAGLLEKPGALTLEERRQMQEHSAIGERILTKVEDYAEIATIVRHHHERMDGMGYPDGVAGVEIPLISRIIAVADAYNAMTSDRPYRDAMPSRVARMRLAQGVEGQFDTTVVAAFEAVLAGATDDYRCGTRVDFTLDAQDRYSSASAEQAA
jgi:putative nucleotidyltransferase with HDIG domain